MCARRLGIDVDELDYFELPESVDIIVRIVVAVLHDDVTWQQCSFTDNNRNSFM